MYIYRIKYLVAALLLGVGLCCCNSKRNTVFESKYPLDTAIRFCQGKNTAYGYTFTWPSNYIVQVDTLGQIDSIIFLSPGKEATLKYFVEGTIDRYDTLKDYLSDYFHQVDKGGHPLVPNCSTVQSLIISDDDHHSKDRGHFIMICQLKEREYVWKTELSTVAFSGNYMFKTMLFSYPIAKKPYYQPIGVALAKYFGTY